MAKHEDINVPKISKGKTLAKILIVFLIPTFIIVLPLFYNQSVELENILTAFVVLISSAYVVFFIL